MTNILQIYKTYSHKMTSLLSWLLSLQRLAGVCQRGAKESKIWVCFSLRHGYKVSTAMFQSLLWTHVILHYKSCLSFIHDDDVYDYTRDVSVFCPMSTFTHTGAAIKKKGLLLCVCQSIRYVWFPRPSSSVSVCLFVSICLSACLVTHDPFPTLCPSLICLLHNSTPVF